MGLQNSATVKMIQNIIDGTTPPTTALNANNATTAASATKATQDGNGNVIATTYAQQESVTNLESCSTLIHSADGGFSAGTNAGVTGSGAIIGKNADASPSSSGASIGMGSFSNDGAGIGKDAVATGVNAVQLGTGTNSNDNTLQFLTYQICDANGNIPAERLANVLDIVYPIGSIYMNYSDNTSPASQLGGTWTQISSGQFLLSTGTSYTFGSTGGSATVTLTTNQIPSHTHNTNVRLQWVDSPVSNSLTASWASSTGNLHVLGGNEGPFTSGVGGGQSHNNMPPYRVVSMWRRTA